MPEQDTPEPVDPLALAGGTPSSWAEPLGLETVERDGVKYFADSALDEAVRAPLAALGADKHTAIVLHADLRGAFLAAAARLPITGTWTIMGALDKRRAGAWTAGARLVVTF
jgi:hypothetical protein